MGQSGHVGLLFAAQRAIAYVAAQQLDQLDQAINSHDLIGQAKGILMERFNIDDQQAFSLLTRISQNSTTRIRDLALELVKNRNLLSAT